MSVCNSVHLLIADDDALMLSMLARRLALHNYTADLAHSSKEALEFFAAHPSAYDLVIIDSEFPDGDGDSVAGKMLQIDETIPILIFSGRFRHPDLDPRIRFLQKGASTSTLLETLSELYRQRRVN